MLQVLPSPGISLSLGFLQVCVPGGCGGSLFPLTLGNFGVFCCTGVLCHQLSGVVPAVGLPVGKLCRVWGLLGAGGLGAPGTC